MTLLPTYSARTLLGYKGTWFKYIDYVYKFDEIIKIKGYSPSNINWWDDSIADNLFQKVDK